MMQIYHNPACRKSRETLQLIKDAGEKVEVIEYIKAPPTAEELTDVLSKLDIKPFELIRKGEAIYKEKFKGNDYSDAEWIKILIENPKLIERPIVIKGTEAIIGRPPENVSKFL